MQISILPLVKEIGLCPHCGEPASYQLISFDSRTIRVNCAGGCEFTISKAALDDALGN
jgi:hypothetical protein